MPHCLKFAQITLVDICSMCNKQLRFKEVMIFCHRSVNSRYVSEVIYVCANECSILLFLSGTGCENGKSGSGICEEEV